jgi:hypothetical protein
VFHNLLEGVSVVPERQNLPSVIEESARYTEWFVANVTRQKNFYYVDETGIQVNSINYEWSTRGRERADLQLQAMRSKTYSISVAMTS